MKNKLKISIITVTKNWDKFLQETIDSLSRQTHQNFEHIIIDGASTDRTLDIIKKNSHQIKKWISEPDDGLYYAINKGIKFCSGDIIGILNSDDVYFPDTLLTVNKYFLENQIDFLFGSVFKHKLLHGYYPEKIKWTFGFYSTHSIGFFIKKESQKKIGFYNIKYKYSQAWPFPSSLMLGFQAEAKDKSLNINYQELEKASWYTRDFLKSSPENSTFKMPGKISIARKLIKDWLD